MQSFGLAVIDLERGADDHPEHDHAQAGQEEVFVVLRGTGTMEVDGDTVDLDPETIVRVGPGAKRRIAPGTGGIRLLGDRRGSKSGVSGAGLYGRRRARSARSLTGDPCPCSRSHRPPTSAIAPRSSPG